MNEIDKMAIIILCDMDYDYLDEKSIPAAKEMWLSWQIKEKLKKK